MGVGNHDALPKELGLRVSYEIKEKSLLVPGDGLSVIAKSKLETSNPVELAVGKLILCFEYISLSNPSSGNG